MAVLLVTIFILNLTLGRDLVKRLDQRLERQAKGAEGWVRRTRHPETLALRLAEAVGARVTIVDLDGVVLGDSDHPDVSRPPVANQLGKAEIKAALAGRIGRATRIAEGGQRMHFLAVPVAGGAILRLGVPLSEITSTLAEMRRRLIYAAALAIVLALALGLLAARVAARPLRAMTLSAQRMAQGEYDLRLPAASPDEFGVLSRSLESLATELRARIGDLTSERDRLSAILGSMIEGVVVVGPDGRVALANPSALRILGTEGSPVGRAVDEVVTHPRVRALLDEGRRSQAGAEAEVEGPEGASLAVNVRPLQAAPGGIVAVLHDVTHLRRLETMRRDFVANVSHELRTPVTAVLGYAETLLGGSADADKQRQFLEIIHRHARRIGRLVEDLLKLADVEVRAPGQTVREPVQVGPVARHVVQTVGERARRMEATVEAAVADDVVAVGDPDWIEQALENLVDNAVKYGKKGGRVTVSGRRDGERVVLEVVDDGPGIEPAHLPRLFERFYRVDAGRSRDLGGTGLGLSIVKHFVEAMGGSITVDSEPGKGTRFVVTLPSG